VSTKGEGGAMLVGFVDRRYYSSVGGENRPLGIDNLLLTYFRSSI
jgi:hypothetical protein